MTANGVAYELPTWARRTDASACSSSPAGANTPDAVPDAPLLGTPRAAEYKGSGPVGSASHTHWLDHGYLTAQVMDLLPTPDAFAGDRGGGSDPSHRRANGRTVALADVAEFRLLPTVTGPSPHDSQHSAGLIRQRRDRYGDELTTMFDLETGDFLHGQAGVQWGAYEPAIRRWEAVMGPAPSPTERSERGAQRLSPRFTEWMMGQPAGWVTDPAIGITRKDMLKACGNGVVTQQAVAALQDMLDSIAAMDPPGRELPTPDGELPGQMSLLEELEGTS
jgi:DNA (cytosine-5)-methyltransferase 1